MEGYGIRLCAALGMKTGAAVAQQLQRLEARFTPNRPCGVTHADITAALKRETNR